MKIVIGDPKTAKSYQTELAKDKESLVFGKHIGDEIDGSLIGAAGYKLKMTGGSDKNGFPMKADVSGMSKKKLVLSKGIGFRNAKRGEMKKKMIRGGTISDETAQISVVIIEAGPSQLDQLFPKSEKAGEEKKGKKK